MSNILPTHYYQKANQFSFEWNQIKIVFRIQDFLLHRIIYSNPCQIRKQQIERV